MSKEFRIQRQQTFTAQRQELVDELFGYEEFDIRILEAIRSVPRENFVPRKLRHMAYRNAALPIGFGQTISQPLVLAIMLQALGLTQTDCVLEVGAGSGYFAALIAQLAGKVCAIERDPRLAGLCRRRMRILGLDRVTIECGNGYSGWTGDEQFDAIAVSACAQQFPDRLIGQLRVGGRLIIPLETAENVQSLMLFNLDLDRNLSSRTISQVRFVPLIEDDPKQNLGNLD